MALGQPPQLCLCLWLSNISCKLRDIVYTWPLWFSLTDMQKPLLPQPFLSFLQDFLMSHFFKVFLNLLQHSICLMFWVFLASRHMRTSSPTRIGPTPLTQREVPTTRLPGKSLLSLLGTAFLNCYTMACILAVVLERSSEIQEINRAVENINTEDNNWKKKSTA